MKTPIALLCSGLVLTAAVLAQQTSAPSRSTASRPLDRGQVLVLDNGQLVEGDIARLGEQYRIRRRIGETWIPAERVLHVAADKEEVYRFFRQRTNLGDADERLKLARWCLQVGLRERALEEALAAAKMRPGFLAAEQFAKGVELSMANAKTAPAAPPTPVAPTTPVEEPEIALPDYNTDSYPMFITKVQPLLMNVCASCHASGKAGNFHLTRVYEIGNKRATHQNLAAVLKQLNRERPWQSPLLTKAITVHGDSRRPPIEGKSALAYRTLENWVRLALPFDPSANPEVVGSPMPLRPLPLEVLPMMPVRGGKSDGSAVNATGFAEESGSRDATLRATASKPSLPTGPSEIRSNELPEVVPNPAPRTLPPEVRSPGASPATIAASRPAQREPSKKAPTDPFDPAIFNEQMHGPAQPDR